MVTNDERREVARRLRAAKRPSLMVLMDVLGVGGEGVFARLADLIEPPTQCPYYHSDRHRCSAYDDVVDRDALLAVADELSEVMCDKRGELSITYGDLQGLARRIREALGADDD